MNICTLNGVSHTQCSIMLSSNSCRCCHPDCLPRPGQLSAQEQSLDSGVSCLVHMQAPIYYLWENYFNCLNLGFLSFQMRIIIVATSENLQDDNNNISRDCRAY
jgi:hypothetical protein